MPQPVKLSDALISVARDAAKLANRSLASQVEHWATLGRAIEGQLTANQSAFLKNAVRESAPQPYSSAQQVNAALSAALARAISPEARGAFATELARSPEFHYSTDPAIPGCILRENPDGTRTPGRWKDDRFVPLEPAPITDKTR